jgi:hypothetical protein
VDIVYRLDKSDDGRTLKRTHTRISWVPETVNLIVEDITDKQGHTGLINIRLKHKEIKGWTQQEIDAAKRLDELGIPRHLGVNEAARYAKERDIELMRKSILGRAIQLRKLPSPDPLETGTTLGNHLTEPNEDKGTTPRTVRYGGVPSLPQPSTAINNQDNINPEEDIW